MNRGRPVRDIINASPIVTQLVTGMVSTRKAEGVTLEHVARTSHYSISALSQATSGQCIPSIGVIKAYARALHVDPAPWLALRALAVEERRRNRKGEESGGSAGVPRPAAPDDIPPSSADDAPARKAGHGHAEADGLPATAAMRVQQLVTEAVGLATPQLHGSPIANVLSLCTVPGDLVEMLRETQQRSEVSLHDVVRRTPAYGVSISKTSLQKLLTSQDLPTAEVLRAILMSCKVPPNEIKYWLYHRARLELAVARRAHRATGAAARPVRTVSYGSRRQVLLTTTLPLVLSMMTLVATLLFGR